MNPTVPTRFNSDPTVLSGTNSDRDEDKSIGAELGTRHATPRPTAGCCVLRFRLEANEAPSSFLLLVAMPGAPSS